MKSPNFFKASRSPYYIYSVDYTDNVAGIKALHYLCHSLNELGFEAYMIGCAEESTHLRSPLLRESDVVRHEQLGLLPIIVYPEVVLGNPLNMPYVARWLLNEPGHLGGDKDFTPGEMIFSYSRDFVPKHWQMHTREWQVEDLHIPTVDTSIFNNINNSHDDKRQGSCYYAHKYLAKGGKLTEHVSNSISVCQDVSLTRQEMAEIFRKSEVLYCYEPSAVITEAKLCGCAVTMIPTFYLAPEVYTNMLSNGLGIAGNQQSISNAKRTVSKAIDDDLKLIDYCWFYVNRFIERTQSELNRRQSEGQPQNKIWIAKVLELISNSHGHTVLKPKLHRSINNNKWLKTNSISEGKVALMAQDMATNWRQQPSFHLIMVINQYELELLVDTLDSLQQQLYGAWGLTIISNIAQPDLLSDLPENIEWIEISSSLNEEINKTVQETGLDWLLQLLPGDKLLPHSLLSFAQHINRHSQNQLIYSDEMTDEKINTLVFKPEFNLELLRSSSYLGRAAIVRRDAFENIGGYTGLAYVEMTDLAFNVYEAGGQEAIGHIDDVLYISAVHSDIDDEVLIDNEITVRLAHLKRLNIAAQLIVLDDTTTFRVKYEDLVQPLVSIIIANKNHASELWLSVEELLAHTEYDNYELIIVDQISDIEDLQDIYQDIKTQLVERFTLLSYAEANYSAMINFAVEQAKGDYIAVIANTAMPVNDRWLNEMCSLAQQNDVAVVGVKVIDADNNIVHAGGVLGIADDVTGMFAGDSFHQNTTYMNRADISQQYNFVSSACFVVNKGLFKSVSGLDEGELANSRYTISDFCLKAQKEGLRNIWTPHAVFRQNMLVAATSNGVCQRDDTNFDALMIKRWPAQSINDQAFNRHLSLNSSGFDVETVMPLSWDRQDSHLKVMAFPFNYRAIGQYRVIEPLRELAHQALIEPIFLTGNDDCQEIVVPTRFEIQRAQPDVLLMHLTLDDEHYEFLQWVKTETDIFVVFSTDDLVQNLPRNNPSKKKLYKDIKYRLKRFVSLCDRVIVSTQPLADEFASYCDDIVVMPNCLDLSRWAGLEPRLNTGKKLRFGWAGGQYHQGDLELIIEVVKQTADCVDWVFMGMCPDELKPYIYEQHSLIDFDDYPQKLASLALDLAIAPLEQHPFNEAKSNLRLLEYGILGWPVICSDIYPYQTNAAPVVRVNHTESDWLTEIMAAIAQPEQLKQQGKQLKKWVEKHYILQNNNEQWLAALSKKNK